MSRKTQSLAPRQGGEFRRGLLVFEGLDIRRAPGFSGRGFSLGSLQGGINIIYGPNAAGKTTAARALASVLWPEAPQLQAAELAARFRASGGAWRVELRGNRARYQRDGNEVSAGPQLAPASSQSRYYLGLAELLTSQNSDFAEYIARESAGGFDVALARENLDYSDNPRALRQGVGQAFEALQQAEASAEALRREAGALRALEQDLAESQDAEQRLDVLERLASFRAESRRAGRVQEELAKFPAAMKAFRADDPARVESLRARRTVAQGELERASEQIEAFREQIAQNMLEEALPATALAALEEYVAELGDVEAELERRRQEFADAQAREESAWQSASASVEPSSIEAVGPEILQRLSDLAASYQRAQSELRALKRFRGLLGNTQRADEAGLEKKRGAMQFLRSWLRAPDPAETGEGEGAEIIAGARASLSPGVGALLLAAIAAIIAGSVAGAALFHLAWLLFLLVALLLVWPLWAVLSARKHLSRFRKHPNREANPREVYRRDFQKSGLKEPALWEPAEVEERLVELERAHAAGLLLLEKSNAWARERELYQQVEARLSACREERDAIRDEVGLNLDLHFGQDYVEGFGKDPAQLWSLLSEVRDWQRARRERAGAQAKVEVLEQRQRALLERVGGLTSSALAESAQRSQEVSDKAAARGVLKALERANSQLLNDLAGLEAARSQKTRAERSVLDIEEEIAGIFKRLELPEDAEHQLGLLADNFGAFQALKDELISAESAARSAQDRLESSAAFSAELYQLEEAAAAEQLVELADMSQRRDELIKEVERIKTLVDAQKKSTAIEDKRAELKAELDDLSDNLARGERRIVGALLSDFLGEQTRDASRPAVFKRARELFSRITRGRYRLLFDEQDGPKFRAYDTIKELGQSLDELSSGTRLQLLLAVRVAFVEQQEEGLKLPLFLDETLANSDDERAVAIIDALKEIAAEGRQVFYFTAQLDEVRKWQQASQSTQRLGSGAAQIHFIDLEKSVDDPAELAASGDEFLREEWVEEAALFGANHIPAVGELSHEEYGARLGVGGALDPRSALGSVHLWYLTTTPGTLSSLMSLGVARWGALENFYEAGGWPASGLVEAEFERIAARARALGAAFSAWRVGRGRQLSRADLEATAAVTETFIDEVSELSEALGGDAKRLLQALHDGQVKGFRSAKREELEDYLEAGGWLDRRAPLDDVARSNHVLAACAGDIASGLITAAQIRQTIARAMGLEHDQPVAVDHSIEDPKA